MLMHLSQTKTLKRFSKALQRQQKPSKQAIPNNIVAFPTQSIHPPKKGKKQPVLDWTERLITKRQQCYIRLLASQQGISIKSLNNDCYRCLGTDLSSMLRTDASDVIQSLKRSLSQQYKPYH